MSLLLVIIGIIVALFVHRLIGLACILIGLLLLLWPYFETAGPPH